MRFFVTRECLNPLKAGQEFGGLPRIPLTRNLGCLNPLKAGQEFGAREINEINEEQLQSQSP